MLPQIHAAVEISSSVLESTAACVSLIKKSDTRQAYLVMIIIIVITMLNSGGRRNYCWSAGILSTHWSSGIRRSCCSDVVLIVSFTVDLQFLWSTSSTDNIDVLNGTSKRYVISDLSRIISFSACTEGLLRWQQKVPDLVLDPNAPDCILLLGSFVFF